MVMRSEGYLTDSGISAVAPFRGICWSTGTYVPFRLARALRRNAEDDYNYKKAMESLKPALTPGNRSPQMTVVEARTDFLRFMANPAVSKNRTSRLYGVA